MLREHPNVRQISGETRRRWFNSENLDLIVWQEPGGPLRGFQLCYRKSPLEESVLTWTLNNGYSFGRLDNGEPGGLGFKMAPTVTPAGHFEKTEVVRLFRDESSSLNPALSLLIIQLIEVYE